MEHLADSSRFFRALAAFDFERYVRARPGVRKEAPHSPTKEFLLRCPFPGCGSSRLRVNADKRTWICWGCHRTGDALDFVCAFEPCTLEGAIDLVMRGYVGGDAKIERLESSISLVPTRVDLRTLPPISWPSGVELLTDPRAVPHARAWQYLTRPTDQGGRGMTPEQVIGWGLGFGRTGRCRDRIVFPVYMDHALVYYQARATWNPPPGSREEQRAWMERTGYRKTINPENAPGHAAAAEIIFNYDRITVEPHVVICEGPVDAIKVGPHACALFGKVASAIKLERLRRLRASRFTVYLDRGAEERACAERIAAELSSFAPVYIAEPPEGYDAGDLTSEQNAWIVSSATRWDGRRLEGV